MEQAQRSAASLNDFTALVLGVRDKWDAEDELEAREDDETWSPTDFWFRGHAGADWSLTPSIYRPAHAGADEVEMHAEFERRGRQLFSETHLPRDHKEWYFLMQHYRTPTRLLDWTDGALLALYFALSEHVREQHRQPQRGRQRRVDAAVWMMDPEWLNRRTWKLLDPEHSYTEGVMLPEWKETDPWFPVPF